MDKIQRYRAIGAISSFHYQTTGQFLLFLLSRQCGKKITEDQLFYSCSFYSTAVATTRMLIH